MLRHSIFQEECAGEETGLIIGNRWRANVPMLRMNIRSCFFPLVAHKPLLTAVYKVELY